LVADGGFGHTSSLYIDTVTQKEKLQKFSERMKTCRILVNTPSSQGGIGDLTTSSLLRLSPRLRFLGGNSVSDNVGVKHLLNIKTVAEEREHALVQNT